MAKIPRVIKWGFDPTKSDMEVLQKPDGLVLWSVLRFGHLVSQHFNQNVADLAHNLRINPPPDAWQLFLRASHFGIRGHGAMQDPKTRCMGMDPEWWGELLEAWRGNLALQHELPAGVTVGDRFSESICCKVYTRLHRSTSENAREILNGAKYGDPTLSNDERADLEIVAAGVRVDDKPVTGAEHG